jgi:hypothetical protein
MPIGTIPKTTKLSQNTSGKDVPEAPGVAGCDGQQQHADDEGESVGFHPMA